MEKLFEILFEDDDLLVVNKEADLVCHPTKGDAYSSLISRVRLHLGPGHEAHLVNRLDRETSGVVVVAKNRAAAGALGRVWESREVIKEYRAIVHGWPPESHAVISAPLGRDETSVVAIKDHVRTDGVPAETAFWVMDRFCRSGRAFALLKVIPGTGRKHQIRIHLAHHGVPIVGDKIYGGDEDLYLALVERRLTAEQHARLILRSHALHAQEVRFQWRGRDYVFSANPGQEFMEFCSSGPTSTDFAAKGT